MWDSTSFASQPPKTTSLESIDVRDAPHIEAGLGADTRRLSCTLQDEGPSKLDDEMHRSGPCDSQKSTLFCSLAVPNQDGYSLLATLVYDIWNIGYHSNQTTMQKFRSAPKALTADLKGTITNQNIGQFRRMMPDRRRPVVRLCIMHPVHSWRAIQAGSVVL